MRIIKELLLHICQKYEIFPHYRENDNRYKVGRNVRTKIFYIFYTTIISQSIRFVKGFWKILCFFCVIRCPCSIASLTLTLFVLRSPQLSFHSIIPLFTFLSAPPLSVHKTFTIFSSKKGLSIESNYEKISEFTIYSHIFQPFLPHFRFFSSPNRFMSLLPLKPNPPVLPPKRTLRPPKIL